jgi:hypothetical protein
MEYNGFYDDDNLLADEEEQIAVDDDEVATDEAATDEEATNDSTIDGDYYTELLKKKSVDGLTNLGATKPK